jgi:phosphoadenosine phosphosulfate reductase
MDKIGSDMNTRPRSASAFAAADRRTLKIFDPDAAMTENATLALQGPGGTSPPARGDIASAENGAPAVLQYPHSPLPAEGTAPAGFQPLVFTPELLEELAEANKRLERAQPEEIIAWAAQRFCQYLTMATAFGPEGSVIVSILADVAPDTYVFNLDTGYQFQETLDMPKRLAAKYGVEVDMLKPELTVAEYEAKHGGPLYKTNDKQCCFDRKIVVLRNAVRGKHAWMSGIRKDQTQDRAQNSIVHWDKKFNLVKISPLLNWTKADVWKRILAEDIPYNPLHDQGYPSIGCEPCTRPVADGETDERAGRWSGKGKNECGLHSHEQADGSGI